MAEGGRGRGGRYYTVDGLGVVGRGVYCVHFGFCGFGLFVMDGMGWDGMGW